MTHAPHPTPESRRSAARHTMSHVLRYQVRSAAALWLWLRGRRVGVGPGDVAIGHARERTPMLLALAGVLAVETAMVGLLVPWPVVHVLDGLALLQVLGIAAVEVTYPHIAGHSGLVVRDGPMFEVRVPLTAIAKVRVARQFHTGPTRRIEDGELGIAVGNQTDVLVELSEPVAVPDGGDGMATRIRFRADDPHAAVSALAAAAPNLA